MKVRSWFAAAAWSFALAAAGGCGWLGADAFCRSRFVPLPSEPFAAVAAAGMILLVHALLSLGLRRKR